MVAQALDLINLERCASQDRIALCESPAINLHRYFFHVNKDSVGTAIPAETIPTVGFDGVASLRYVSPYSVCLVPKPRSANSADRDLKHWFWPI